MNDTGETVTGILPTDDRNYRRCDIVINASKQSPLAGINHIDVEPIAIHDDSSFFQENTPNVSIAQDEFKRANIFNNKIDEGAMQSNLCSFLDQKGITVHTLKNPDPGGNRRKVQEQTLTDFLDQKYGSNDNRNGSQDERPQKLRRIELSLSVTTTSRCDVCCIQVENQRLRHNREFIFGELKHGQKYTVSQCLSQGSLYLQILLYYLRATLGIPVDFVYGFAVCGPRCADVEAYTVVLLKATAPTFLGGPIMTYCCCYEAINCNDSNPIKKLLQFLSHGKRSAPSTLTAAPRNLPQSSLFLLPNEWWENTSNDIQRLSGGTVANVFKTTLVTTMDLVKATQSEEAITSSDFKNFIREEQFSRLNPFSLPFRRRFPYVVKIRRGSSVAFDEFLEGDVGDELRKTYPLRAYYCEGRESYVIIMRNRGNPVNGSTFSSFSDLKKAFQCVWDTTKRLCVSLPPCDTLPHNMVYDEHDKMLHLIDVDEGNSPGLPIMDRVIEKTTKCGDKIFTCYPNILAFRPFDYAIVQLSQSFHTLYAMSDEIQPTATEAERSSMDVLETALHMLREEFFSNRFLIRDHSNPLPERIQTALEALTLIMTTWFGNWQ